jgi:hypothetical protein
MRFLKPAFPAAVLLSGSFVSAPAADVVGDFLDAAEFVGARFQLIACDDLRQQPRP